METTPTLLPIGDNAILIRFGTQLRAEANLQAVGLSQHLRSHTPVGVLEIVPNLISVLVRYDPCICGFEAMAGEIRLAIAMNVDKREVVSGTTWKIPVSYGDEHGPDLEALSLSLDLTPEVFVTLHMQDSLRVLATGFAPGFVYCGFHTNLPAVARRTQIRRQVPAGSILFAAGQTAIASTPVPTGWHVIGRTTFSNFDADLESPTKLAAGDIIDFCGVNA
jgi:5-oxoprolinase (ATP-hydrolysing) subunit B